MDTNFGTHAQDDGNPMYFNVNEVPVEWREKARVLLCDRTIRGDGKTLMGIRKIDLLAAIEKRRLELQRLESPESPEPSGNSGDSA